MTTTIWERIATALTSLTIPIQAGNVYIPDNGESVFPEAYIVYFVISGPPKESADDQEISRLYHIQVSYYATAGLLNMPDIIGLMKTAGFGYLTMNEIPRTVGSLHYGLALEFNYLEIII
jgi:hypothetical protein